MILNLPFFIEYFDPAYTFDMRSELGFYVVPYEFLYRDDWEKHPHTEAESKRRRGQNHNIRGGFNTTKDGIITIHEVAIL